MPILDVRAALRGLEAKGLIGRIPGSAQRFRLASAPDDAFRPLVRQRRAELQAMRSDVGALAEEYRNRRQRPDGERVDVLFGNAATNVTRLVAGAAVEVCALGTDRARALPARGRAARRPGVRVRAVYPRASLARVDGRREIKSAVRAGALVRVVDEPPFALLIVDRSVALVAARTDSGRRDRGDDSGGERRGRAAGPPGRPAGVPLRRVRPDVVGGRAGPHHGIRTGAATRLSP